ncbi:MULTISPECIES: hypothetical protein [Citrobacter]|uniref:hypothetical protein n=1 Tax=Citrobacter TaxID=544 RepID=UPI000846EC8F|nr:MULTISPECIES: hypothetical protein [Citrobacter]BBV29947.1 hypothetical protein STW0522CIT01_14360 [Citrobacter freundii]MBQ4923116.1 hypothetical protein [Citrobacter werkmanii]MBQ4938492.1 hypothetical protein [Citrobacter werkmanii]MBQ4949312.1 hypothetical protein [Citrobacter werkmanii]MBQ4966846.1 hypothetical protein [Citrobacter werkmanii]
MSFAAIPEKCHSYFTELVRSSNYSFNEWNLKTKEVNLIIDEEDNSIIRVKLVVDTDGSGIIGWVLFEKIKSELLNTTIDPEKPIKLTYNNEYEKAQKYCLSGEVVYLVQSKRRVCFYEKTDSGMKKQILSLSGDYVKRLEIQGKYTQVSYQTKSGTTVTDWVELASLRQIDFKSTW